MKILSMIVAKAVFYAALTFLAATLFFLFLERPSLVYRNVPFPAPTSIKPGQRLPVTVTACNTTDKTIVYVLTRTFENIGNHAPIVIPNATIHFKPGCVTATSMATQIPADMPKGFYKVVGISIIEGTMRTFNVPWETTIFEVL